MSFSIFSALQQSILQYSYRKSNQNNRKIEEISLKTQNDQNYVIERSVPSILSRYRDLQFLELLLRPMKEFSMMFSFYKLIMSLKSAEILQVKISEDVSVESRRWRENARFVTCKTKRFSLNSSKYTITKDLQRRCTYVAVMWALGREYLPRKV